MAKLSLNGLVCLEKSIIIMETWSSPLEIDRSPIHARAHAHTRFSDTISFFNDKMEEDQASHFLNPLNSSKA